MNIFIACELGSLEKIIIQNNLKKHNLYFSNQVFNTIADNNYLKCEIVFGNIPSNWVVQSSKIKWIQLESTGFGEYSKLRKNFLKKDVIIVQRMFWGWSTFNLVWKLLIFSSLSFFAHSHLDLID